MNRMPIYASPFLAACIFPALLITIPYVFSSFAIDDGNGWVRIELFGVMAFLVSAAHVLFLGVPLFLVVETMNFVRCWSAVAGGFVLACIPVAVWTWPLRYGEGFSSSHWDGEKMVTTVLNGVVTTAGWISYAKAILFMGSFGAIGGLSFWLVWRLMNPHNSFNTGHSPP